LKKKYGQTPKKSNFLAPSTGTDAKYQLGENSEGNFKIKSRETVTNRPRQGETVFATEATVRAGSEEKENKKGKRRAPSRTFDIWCAGGKAPCRRWGR